LIYRGFRSDFRAGKLLVLGLVLAVLAVVTWYYLYQMWRIDTQRGHAEPSYTVWRNFGYILLGVQYVAGMLYCPARMMDLLPTERSKRTEEFLTTLPLTGRAKVFGLLIGNSALPLVVMAAFCPVVILSLLAGHHELPAILWTQVFLVLGWAATSLLALLIGIGMGGFRLAWVGLLVFVIVSIGLGAGVLDDAEFLSPALLVVSPSGLLAALLRAPQELPEVFLSGNYKLFRWPVPWQLAPTAFYLLLAVACFWAAARRFSRPSSPPMQRGMRLIFLAILHVMILGFFAQAFQHVESYIYYSNSEEAMRLAPEPWEIREQWLGTVLMYLYGFFIVLFVMGLLDLPSQGSQMEWLGQNRRWAGQLVGRSYADLRIPPLAPLAVEWLIAVAAMLWVDRFYWDGRVGFEAIGLVGLGLGLFLLGYLALCNIGILLARKWGKGIGLLLVAAVFCVPAIFATLDQTEDLLKVTAIGPAYVILDEHEAAEDWMVVCVAAGILAAGALAVMLGMLASLRRKSPAARKAMASAA
jgi:hypothetical protein